MLESMTAIVVIGIIALVFISPVILMGMLFWFWHKRQMAMIQQGIVLPPDHPTLERLQMGRRLYRSQSNRILAGVCGGLGDYFGIDPSLIRIAFLASLLLPGTQIIFYFIAWLIIPDEPLTTIAQSERGQHLPPPSDKL